MSTKINKLTLQGFKSFRKRISIPFLDGFNVVCGPNGSGKSLSGSSEVLISNGEFKSIKEIVEDSFEKSEHIYKMDDGYYNLENPDNIKVLGLDPETHKVVEKNIASFIKREGEKNLFRTITRSGREITSTNCHPVMKFKNGKIESVNISELEKNDLIAVPKRIDINPVNDKINLPEGFDFEKKQDHYLLYGSQANTKKVKIPKRIDIEFARFFGYLIGDGYINHNRCELTNTDNNLIRDFKSVSKLFGLRTKLHTKGNIKKATIHSTLLSKFIQKFLDNKIRSGTKKIPRQILFGKKRILANFLAALFDCDIYIPKNNSTLEYSTKSKQLAKQVQFALLRFGINSTFREKEKHATNTKNQVKRKYYSIYINGLENLSMFTEKFRVRSKKKVKRLGSYLKRIIDTQDHTDIFPKQVNDYIHETALVLGVNIKETRKKFPKFAAYCENRCYPTRDGIQKSLAVLEHERLKLERFYEKADLPQEMLVEIIRESPLMLKDAAESLGVHYSCFQRWESGCTVEKKKLNLLKKFIKTELKKILEKSEENIKLLKTLVNSDVIWDKVTKIEKAPAEEWVYDLCIPNCHNFIADLVFVHNSNILDAVSFVLGRTSTKSMRADRLNELIYHGHKGVKPSEQASVTMWLDNSKEIFPFEDPEITVSRRVNKKGSSIYKLNGKTTTREKILEVLNSVGIHPDGFNMIMQGDVTQVVEMSPEERREILDQVAGISLYDEKKDKAISNLEMVGEKMKEVEIILTERLERLQDLERDRNTALKYKGLVDELKILNASLAYKKYQEQQGKHGDIEGEIQENEARIKQLEKKVKELEKDIGEKESRRKNITEKIFIRSKEAGLRQEIEDIKNKIIRNKNRIESDEREIARINEMIGKLRDLQSRSGSFSRAVKTILGLNKPRVHGTVSSIVKIPNDYKAAAEVAAGSRFWNVVVNDANTAAECINFLKKERVGRATFLPLNKIKPRRLSDKQKVLLKRPGVIGLLSNLVKYNPKYLPAVKHIFGSTVVVENLGVARKLGIGRVRMVTLDGDLAETSGAMIGGYYKKKQQTASSEIELEEYEQVKKDLEEEINFLRIEVGQLNEKMDKLREKYEQESQSVLDLDQERTSLDEKLIQMKQRRNELFDERAKTLDRTNKLKIRGAKTEAEISSLKLEVDRYEDVEYLDEKMSVLEEKIDKTTYELNSLGLVNMKAIDEYEKFKGEFDKLREKYDSIRDERDAIMEMIEKIEGKKKEVFYDCLRSVDSNFRDIFKDIAKGEASLKLEDEIDIQSGLLIQASPGGKNLLNIDAMSGGEKTLTALAFLFAIQRYRAAPFYILDEVDAALDKVNTKKITDLIKKLAEREQFIMITHNDHTIKQGDRVYGVSMEGGESKILGLELPGTKAG